MKKISLLGLSALVILIGAFGFVLYKQYTEIQVLKKEFAKSEKPPEQHNKQQDISVSEAVKPPPPGETNETGYWNGDYWHRTVPSNEDNLFEHTAGIPDKQVALTPQELAQLEAKLSQLDKTVKEKSVDNVKLSLEIYDAGEKLKAEYVLALEAVERNKKAEERIAKMKEITASVNSGEISPDEGMRQLKQITESSDAQEFKQHVQNLKESNDESN